VARKCSICTHPQRMEIDKALISNVNLRNISEKYAVTEMSLSRHRKNHLAATLAQAKAMSDMAQAAQAFSEITSQQSAEQLRANTLWSQIAKGIQRVNMLFDACHKYLEDPENPGKYDLGARSEDITVIYKEPCEHNEDAPAQLSIFKGSPASEEKEVRRKRKLSELLSELEERAGIKIERATIRHSDIRELILKTMSEARSNLSFLANLEVIDHNVRQSRQFTEELLAFLDELGPNLRDRFLERIREKRMMRSAFSISVGDHLDDEIQI
jgi:hypothetical protein